jgi:hypothetical protein
MLEITVIGSSSSSSGGGGDCSLTLTDVSNGGSGYGMCEGDCDDNSDCQPGLECFKSDGGDRVPGCLGVTSDNNYDYCYDPTAASCY